MTIAEYVAEVVASWPPLDDETAASAARIIAAADRQADPSP